MVLTRRGLLTLAGAMGFAANASAAGHELKFPFRMTRNQAWTVVFINGRKDPLPFQFDTGANFFSIAQSTARSLGLVELRRDQVQGLVGRADFPMFKAASLVVANAMRESDVPLVGIAAEPWDGLCGSIPAPREGIMAMDFDALQITLSGHNKPDLKDYDRLPCRPTGLSGVGGSVERMGEHSINEALRNQVDTRPVISVELDGGPVRLMVDTGTTDSVLLFPDFVRAKGLWDRYPKYAESQIATLVKPVTAREVRCDSLKIGRVLFRTPVVTLADPARSNEDGAQPYDGLIGMELLRRFNLVHDPFSRELFLKPNQMVRDLYRYDRAGLAIAAQSGGLRVTWVATGGPAEKAGLKLDDKVTGWAGLDGYDGLMWAMHGAPGTIVKIQVERGGQPQLIEITLVERI